MAVTDMSHFHSRPDPGVLYVGSEEANWGIILPVKDSHTRIKPLAFTSGHGRYITVTPEQTLMSVCRWGMAVTYSRYKFVNVSIPKRLCNGRFTSETATWIQKWFKMSIGTCRKL